MLPDKILKVLRNEIMTNAKSTLRLIAVAVILCQASFLKAAEKAEGNGTAAFTVKVTGSGRPMVLIPGLSCGGNVWDGTVDYFKDRYECHIVTLAGFAGQPAIGGPFLEQVRDGLIKYIRDKKLERPVIVGHSLGGFLAFWLGATVPEQVGPIIAVDGVPYFPALNDVNATPQSVQPFAEMMRTMYKMQTPAQFAIGNRGFLAGAITDPKDVEKVAALSTKSDPKTVGQAFYEIMTIDLREKVKAIRTPVLLIGATAAIPDPGQKKAAEENYRLQVANIPKHKVVFAPKARHFIQLDEPKFFFQEMESFLKGTDAAKGK
jgi:pimeloyl-ACP methyl ester carboxylesterase